MLLIQSYFLHLPCLDTTNAYIGMDTTKAKPYTIQRYSKHHPFQEQPVQQLPPRTALCLYQTLTHTVQEQYKAALCKQSQQQEGANATEEYPYVLPINTHTQKKQHE